MVRPQLRRAAAAFALTSSLALLPVTTTEAANKKPRAEHARAVTPEPRGSWIRGLLLHVMEKVGVKIDPDGGWIVTSSDDPH
jgi:hypothetical protein